MSEKQGDRADGLHGDMASICCSSRFFMARKRARQMRSSENTLVDVDNGTRCYCWDGFLDLYASRSSGMSSEHEISMA